MIDLSQEVLISLIIKSFLCGVGLGIFYDVIRMFKVFLGVKYTKQVYSSGKLRRVVEYIVTFIFDIIFWIAVGLISIILIYSINGGVFRGMTYFWMLSGFLLYYFTVGTWVLKLTVFLDKKIKKALYSIAKLLILPLRRAFDRIICLYRLTIGKFIGKIKDRIKDKKEKRKNQAMLCEKEKQEVLGKEDFVYVDQKTRYKREGRINFGNKSA